MSYGVKGELRNHESKSEIAALYYGEPPIFAYGAGRFMGRENLSNIALEDPIASHLAGPTEWYDAEEILSELDYAAAKKKRGAKKRLETVKQMLTKILPHVKRIDL